MLWIEVGAAFLIGLALRFVVNLEPVWWLAWFVPGLLFALALRAGNWRGRGLVALAALIGVTVNVPLFAQFMPMPILVLVMTLMTLLWVLVMGTARRIVLAFDSRWTILALPVVAVAVDTLLAHFTPDGNWGSLAYTQAEVLPVAQLAAVFGVGGILFVLMLANSALAFALTYGVQGRGAPITYVSIGLVAALTVAFGYWRLSMPATGTAVTFGIASVDDFIGDAASEHSRAVWQRYDVQVRELAGKGAKQVLLPEKIGVLAPADAEIRKTQLALLAREQGVWLTAGLGVDNGTEKRNEAWVFAPDGRLVTNYLKHFLAPPERDFVSGTEFPVNEIEGVNYGVAICKDMHFASLGRGFGERGAGVMFVPAWDFDADDWMAANMTKLRGVENGYTIVRASRNGLLSISDSYGRMLAVERSKALPGTTLLATVNVGARVPTIYTHIGDLLGWICVGVFAVLLPWSLVRSRRSKPTIRIAV